MISVMMSPKLRKTVGQARHQNGEAKMYNQWGEQHSSPLLLISLDSSLALGSGPMISHGH